MLNHFTLPVRGETTSIAHAELALLLKDYSFCPLQRKINLLKDSPKLYDCIMRVYGSVCDGYSSIQSL